MKNALHKYLPFWQTIGKYGRQFLTLLILFLFIAVLPAQNITDQDSPEQISPGTIQPAAPAKPLPELPAQILAPGAPIKKLDFSTSWHIKIPELKDRQLVSLEIPESVYNEARPDLGDIRIMTAEHQVPYIRWTPTDSKLMLNMKDTVPQYDIESRNSTIKIDLPLKNVPLISMELSTPSFAFTRNVILSSEITNPRRHAPKEHIIAQPVWNCPAISAPPCTLPIPLPLYLQSPLRISFVDADNAPLPKVTIKIWRRRDVLIFPNQPGKDLYLLAGAPTLNTPRYDLELLRNDILTRPHTSAYLEAKTPLKPFSSAAYRWLFLSALGCAALVLLLVLSHLFRRSKHPE